LTLHGLFTQENTPLEIVEIGQTVTKVNLLYLARIQASINYSSVYSVLIATHWVIGEKQLTIVYFQIWNHLKLYLNWFSIVVWGLGFFTLDTVWF